MPLALPLPSPSFERHRPTLAALFETGTLPLLRRKPRENPLAYTVRALGEWARSYRAPLEVRLEDAQRVLEEFAESLEGMHPEDRIMAGPSDLIVRAYGPQSDTSSAAAMLEALHPLHPRLGGSLLTHIGRVTGRVFGILTPNVAWDLALMHSFCGSERDFWEEHRYRAAHDLGKTAKQLTRAELREYIQRNEIMTPGEFKRTLGAGVFASVRRPLSLEDIRQIITAGAFPEAQRRQIEAVLVLLADIDDMGRRLWELAGDGSHVLHRMHDASHARYATVLDVTPWEQLESRWGFLQELLNDIENVRMQGSSDEEGPNFAMLLRPGDGSVTRFREAAALLDSCLQAVLHLTWEIAGWEG